MRDDLRQRADDLGGEVADVADHGTRRPHRAGAGEHAGPRVAGRARADADDAAGVLVVLGGRGRRPRRVDGAHAAQPLRPTGAVLGGHGAGGQDAGRLARGRVLQGHLGQHRRQHLARPGADVRDEHFTAGGGHGVGAAHAAEGHGHVGGDVTGQVRLEVVGAVWIGVHRGLRPGEGLPRVRGDARGHVDGEDRGAQDAGLADQPGRVLAQGPGPAEADDAVDNQPVPLVDVPHLVGDVVPADRAARLPERLQRRPVGVVAEEDRIDGHAVGKQGGARVQRIPAIAAGPDQQEDAVALHVAGPFGGEQHPRGVGDGGGGVAHQLVGGSLGVEQGLFGAADFVDCVDGLHAPRLRRCRRNR